MQTYVSFTSGRSFTISIATYCNTVLSNIAVIWMLITLLIYLIYFIMDLLKKDYDIGKKDPFNFRAFMINHLHSPNIFNTNL